MRGAGLAPRRDSKLDASAVAAGEQLHVEDAFPDLGPIAHECRPAAADATNPKMLDP